MTSVDLARWQFGITTVYHWFFVPVTLALSMIVAIFQTMWVRTDNEKYLRLTKFYGKLFLINFAMGVVTGIVQEFQFGMNWSEYSRFVGDIFGAPLAFEALLAFFMESTFLGLWIFGWDKLPKKLHLATIWLAAIGTNLSAIFILAANSWMQNPVGAVYNPATNRAEMADFLAVLTNPVMLVTFPHTIMASWMTAGGFVAAVSGWHLAKINKKSTDTVGSALRGKNEAAHRFAAAFGAWALIASGVALLVSGDLAGKIMTEYQPMKMAAAEALYETEGGGGACANFSVLSVGSLDGKTGQTLIPLPCVLSFLATGDWHGKVEGINPLQQAYSSGQLVNPDNKLAQAYQGKLAAQHITDFAPYIPVTYWSFRLMMGMGFLAMAIGAWILWTIRKGKLPSGGTWWTAAMITVPLLPLFANSFGWIFTEMGRQPWLVAGVLGTSTGVSPGVTPLEVILSMVLYTVIYGVLAVVEVGLMLKYIKADIPVVETPEIKDEDDVLSFAY